jgi:hypothetical protein
MGCFHREGDEMGTLWRMIDGRVFGEIYEDRDEVIEAIKSESVAAGRGGAGALDRARIERAESRARRRRRRVQWTAVFAVTAATFALIVA